MKGQPHLGSGRGRICPCVQYDLLALSLSGSVFDWAQPEQYEKKFK